MMQAGGSPTEGSKSTGAGTQHASLTATITGRNPAAVVPTASTEVKVERKMKHSAVVATVRCLLLPSAVFVPPTAF
jgi:hypothetical protein